MDINQVNQVNINQVNIDQLNLALNFQNEILKKVSRSFALTIPELPEPLIKSVANGYLLCRITDTIEDDLNLSVDQKLYFHNKFIIIITKITNFDLQLDLQQAFIQELHPLLSEKTSTDEKLLILNLHQVLLITSSLPLDHQISLKKCVTIMNSGMPEFERNIKNNGLKNNSELERYCYVVAGVVGEMLTELFYSYLYTKSYKLPIEILMPLARSFGQALQMTNILKDRWSDYARHICYLPRDLFGNIFEITNINDLLNNPNFKHNIHQLININFEHLKNALNYILLIPKQEIGIRRFCLWAVGMSVSILHNIKKNPGFTDVAQIKISKTKLKIIIFITNFVAKSNYLLKLWLKLIF